MLSWVASLVVLLFVGCLSQNQGLQFTLDSTPDTYYCGHLHCSIDVNQNDPRIFSVVGLSISSIVQSNTLIKLASISVFDPVPQENTSEGHDLTATGSIFHNHGNLVLSLRNDTYCLSGFFVCELDFVDVSSRPDVIRKTVYPSDQCSTFVNQLVEITANMTSHSDNLESQLAELRSQNVAMETKLNNALDELSKLQGGCNSSTNTSQQVNQTSSCVRGEPHNEPRVKFMLWGQVPALCDTETDGGGWVIIQTRTKFDVDFYQGWDVYKHGFGTPDTDFWFGNDNIHNLTSQGYTNLRVDMEYQGQKYFAEYSNFSVADEISKYMLTVGGYHGNATDQLHYNSGMFFTTFDKDNDLRGYANCAATNQFHGAWWYNDCSFSNLNGIHGEKTYQGLCWSGIAFPGSVTWSEMKVRHV